MENNNIKILAISGSLRANSSNNSIIKNIAQLVDDSIYFQIYEGLGKLPHFDDSEEVAESVKELRHLIQSADGVLICTPEYAFGVPGVLKNALDWTVSSGEFYNKPVAVITAATGGENAHASLLLTLKALTAKIPDQSKLIISFVRSKLDSQGNVKDEATINSIKEVIASLIETIKSE